MFDLCSCRKYDIVYVLDKRRNNVSVKYDAIKMVLKDNNVTFVNI